MYRHIADTEVDGDDIRATLTETETGIAFDFKEPYEDEDMLLDSVEVPYPVLADMARQFLRGEPWEPWEPLSMDAPDPEDETVTIRWVPEDVKTLRPNLTDDEAADMLSRIGKHLQDRSIELGWQVMEDLIGWEEDETEVVG